jgi:hypothetical protein
MKGAVKEKTRHQAQRRPLKTVREAVGVFHDPGQLEAAIDELQTRGFMRQEISVLAGEGTIQKKLGHLYKRVQQAEDDPKAPRMIFVSSEDLGAAKAAVIGFPLFVAAVSAGGAVVISGGLLLDALIYAATAGAVGAGIGSMLATFIAKKRAEYLQKQVDHGGILLWVHLRSPESEKLAQKILRKHSAEDVHIHDIPVFNKKGGAL